MGFIDCKNPSVDSTCEGCRKWGGAEQPWKLRIFKFQELARATKNFSEKNILGKGSHSIVYRAVLNDGEVVAVKRPSLGRRTLHDAISFDNELEILSKLRHRHLVNLIGFCNEAREKLLVVEFMENGTLFDNLHSCHEPLSWSTRMHMALQAAKAMEALHSASPPIIHRDVKSSNVLVDRNWNAKLSDLGLAVRGPLDDVTSHENPPAGTMGYIDPEYQTPSQLSSKSDVFSFGILLLEILSGRKAIDVRFNPSSLIDWAVPLIKHGKALAVCDPALKPPQNIEVVHSLAALAARAVRQSKDRRPTMAEVVEGLQRIRKKLPSSRFGSHPPRVPRIAVHKGEFNDLSSEYPVRGNSPENAVPTGEARAEGVFFSEDLNKSSEESSSPSDSEHSNNVYGRGWIYGDGYGQVPGSPILAFSPAARLATSKSESPIFDSSTTLGSPLRVDLIRTLAGSPKSPFSGSPQKSGDRNTVRRSLESPTFGSKKSPIRTMDARSSGTSPRISTQGAQSGLKWNENSAPGHHRSQGRTTIDSERGVQWASQNSSPKENSSQVLRNRNKDTITTQLTPSLKHPPESGMPTRYSGVGGSANRDSEVDSISHPKVPFRMDDVPIWGVAHPAVQSYNGVESHFVKVDLQIAV